jgi:hypothetical protein
MMLSNSIVGCVLMRLEAWAAVGGYDPAMTAGNEDWDLWLRLEEAGWGVVEVDEPLFRYRKHGLSMSVATEADFEAQRSAFVARHPELYNVARLRRLKQAWYPLVSVITEGAADLSGQDLDDLEVVSGETVSDAVAAARGKYVIDWRDVAGVEPDTLWRLSDRLESDPTLGTATGRDPSLAMVRRWSLLDPAGPSGSASLDIPGAAAGGLTAGAFPDPAWSLPAQIDGVPVQRQRPEEEGRMPSWVQ